VEALSPSVDPLIVGKECEVSCPLICSSPREGAVPN
jgi:hypothetical protein